MDSPLTEVANVISGEPISFRYSGIDDLLQRVLETKHDSLTVVEVSQTEFNKIALKARQPDATFRVSLYIAEMRTVIIIAPLPIHEQLHRTLDDIVTRETNNMNLFQELDPVGSGLYQRLNNAGQRISAGQGDSARKPNTPRPRGDAFPTIVIEGGYRQSLPSLRAEARWWFWVSAHDVRIAVIAKLFLQRGEILIEVWSEQPQNQRQGPSSNTRGYSHIAPRCIQTITINRANGITPTHPNILLPASYVVAGAPLRLRFTDVFLRNPVPPVEMDYSISAADLRQYAVRIWRAVLS
ncbi:hypothetical protein F5884DRAFT_832518 [Xylogone sp. PMI_703]|nr:hypothetical protein F5884DRAFT_832518 [Xylogone sp. PMI_703]